MAQNLPYLPMTHNKQTIKTVRNPANTGATVKLGLMPPLTGLVGIYGREIVHAGQIACQEINEKGGVLGRPLELVIEDDGSLPESAVAAAEKLVDRHQCTAIIGNLLSNSRISVAYRVAEPRKIPLLNFSFYEGSIQSRYFFHFAALPNQQIDKMIPCMAEKYGARMFFAGNNYEWPRGSIDAGKHALEQAGGEVLGEEYCPIGVDIGSIDRLLDNVEKAAPDVFVPYFAGTDQVSLLTRFTERGLKHKMAVVMGHYDEMMASRLSPEVRQGFYSSNTFFMSIDNAENKNYLARLAQLPDVTGIWPNGDGILTNFGEGTYICVKAFAKAANQAGSLDSEALVEALKQIGVSAPQGRVQMNPEHHHAKVNTWLSRCDADGVFNIIEKFGAIEPVLPRRYNHQRITHQATLEDDIRLQARMLQQMSEAILLTSTGDNTILYTSAGAKPVFGYDKGEMTGLSISRLYNPAAGDPETRAAKITAILNQTGEWQGEINYIKKDGTPNWCAVTISTFTHPVYGEVWLSVHRDITERIATELALRESENRFHTLARRAPVGIFQTDTQGKCIYVNETWLEFTGMQPDKALGDGWADALHPDDKELVYNTWNECALNNKAFALEYRFQRADGSSTWIYGQAEANRDETGNILNYVGTITNIDERKKAELEHVETQRRLRKQQRATLVFAQKQKNAPSSLHAVYRQLCETVASHLDIERVSVWLLNESGDSLICQDLFVASNKQHEQGMALSTNDYPAYFNAIKSNRIVSATNAASHPDTREFAYDYLKSNRISSMMDAPLRDGNGNVIGIVCHEHVGKPRHWHSDEENFARSVADMLSLSIELFARMQTENELTEYRNHLEKMVEQRTLELEQSNQELESFTYSVSHDLRTPLRGIDGFSRILLKNYAAQLDDKGQDYLNRVRNSARRMGQLIDDMLQMSRASREKLTLQSINLSNIATQCVDELRQAEPGRHIDLKITPDLQAETDPRQMRMVLDNLLGNAWKFSSKTAQACIEFGCQTESGETVYFVRDNGCGFDMRYVDKLFQVFQRLHQADEYPGTGVGLATVARLIKRLGGRIRAESEPGKGASFYFTLENHETSKEDRKNAS